MKSDFASWVFALFAIVLGGALEELLPAFADVGFPILLSAAAYFASVFAPAAALATALAAGAFEDALSVLPFATSASFFLAVALVVRRTGLPSLVAIAAYPLYQVWLAVWLGGIGGGVFGRVLASLPLAALAVPLVTGALARIRRKGALGER